MLLPWPESPLQGERVRHTCLCPAAALDKFGHESKSLSTVKAIATASTLYCAIMAFSCRTKAMTASSPCPGATSAQAGASSYAHCEFVSWVNEPTICGDTSTPFAAESLLGTVPVDGEVAPASAVIAAHQQRAVGSISHSGTHWWVLSTVRDTRTSIVANACHCVRVRCSHSLCDKLLCAASAINKHTGHAVRHHMEDTPGPGRRGTTD